MKRKKESLSITPKGKKSKSHPKTKGRKRNRKRKRLKQPDNSRWDKSNKRSCTCGRGCAELYTIQFMKSTTSHSTHFEIFAYWEKKTFSSSIRERKTNRLLHKY